MTDAKPVRGGAATTANSGNTMGEFLSIPKAIRTRRGVSWPARAVACLLRFRQRDRESVSIGVRRLARDLGIAKATAQRALEEAEAKGLIRTLNRRDQKRGQRLIYDARLLDSIGSVSGCGTLSAANKCTRGEDTTVLDPGTPECPKPEDTTVPSSGTRQEEVKKNDLRREEEAEQRLLSLAFSGTPTPRQRTALLDAVHEARRAGVPYPWMASALVSGKVDGSPWRRIDEAIRKAKDVVASINRSSRKTFEDLRHVVEYAANGGDGLPPGIQIDGVGYPMENIVRRATEWPEPQAPDG